MCLFYAIQQENVKYLPGIKLGNNVIADPDLENAGNFIYLILQDEIRLSSLIVSPAEAMHRDSVTK